MRVSRRKFVQAAAAAGAALVPGSAAEAQGRGGGNPVPTSILALQPLPNPAPPIADDERRARIAKAQRLMAEQGIGAIVLESGTSMSYFVNVRWGLSERPFLLVMPAKGEPAYICPGFEEQRAREVIRFSTDVRVWQEDEDPLRLVGGILKDRGVATARIGVEERVRFFIADALGKALPASQVVLATPITAGCRMYKSPAEIANMQYANDITIAGFKAGLATLREGMTQGDLAANIGAAFRQLGASGGVSVSFGKYTAFPHGSIEPQRLKDGDFVQIDNGVSWNGYQADITRTAVFGKPTARQTEVWNLEKKAQAAAFAAAQVGATCESVDAAARKVITDAGFGPGYKVPGLPHRTGHGIGMDGHEWTNFVKGNTTKLAPGMCFSDEPMIAIYGEFGVRLEDCLYITPDGPKFFTPPSPAIDQPFA
ncbi:MAG TPA: Xaa-Pro peptidase family protein [Vicinamibacterales bacterium]|nr:Xaa-Pro peptidase family protein [Vicinamibacterales bacterium]